MEKLKVGICGWGNVATGLFKALEKNSDIIALNAGAKFTVSVIGARRDNPQCDPGRAQRLAFRQLRREERSRSGRRE